MAYNHEFYSKLENHLKTEDISFEQKGKNSKGFKFNIQNTIISEFENIFKIKINKEMFNEVCNGTGNEISKITSIWSSSLLSFLIFSSISSNGGIIIPTKELDSIIFNKAYFEFLNPTFENDSWINKNNVSNMDSVLISQDNKTILFIESKFKEYITDCDKIVKLSNKYDDNFTKESFKQYNIISQNKNHYLYGLKQLVTHCSGLNNFARNIFHNSYLNNKNDRRNDIIKAKINGAKVYFIEIIYDLSILGYEKEFNDYKMMSNIIYNSMKTDISNVNSDITILDLITYQDVLKNDFNRNNIAAKILDFYKL